MKEETIAAVDRAMDILLAIHAHGGEVGVSELAAQLGLQKSSVYRTLKTMELRGFLQQNPENEKYWFGLQAFAIGMAAGERLQLKDIAAGYTKELYQAFHETVNVSVLDATPGRPHHSIVIHKESAPGYVLAANQPVGSRNPCYCSSVGKCLLAFTPGLDFSVYEPWTLPQYTANTLCGLEELQAELARIRQQGYAIDNEEMERGLTCVGAPILDKQGNAVAAISISGPSVRVADEAQLSQCIAALQRAAQEIGRYC